MRRLLQDRGTLFRGLWARRGLSAAMLVVAVIAAAAATTGPLYYNAARTSIVQDDLHTAGSIGRGADISNQMNAGGGVKPLLDTVTAALADEPAAGLFGPAITALEYTGSTGNTGKGVLVVTRDGVCAHLHLRQGRCATAPREVMVSATVARLESVAVNDVVQVDGFVSAQARPVPLRVVGIYAVPDPAAPYWFARDYFPSISGHGAGPEFIDAFFTVRQTFDDLVETTGITAVVDLPLNINQVTALDVGPVETTLKDVTSETSSAYPGSFTVTSLDSLLDDVHRSWRALALPVVLITAQLLVLCWLLLFLVVTDAAEARGPEVALAKLRGLNRPQTVTFGLLEPMLLLAVALPFGALVGWVSTKALSTLLLREGTGVSMTALGWAAAAVAIGGGVAAATLAARRTLTRPVIAQWRRTERRLTGRAWVAELVLVTATIAGLVELFATGTFDSASDDVLALLVPGLLCLAIALLAARLLPVLCARAFGLTRGHGGIASFLAVRQVARRPGGLRTTVALATAFGLATFAISAWTVARGNLNDVSYAQVGAATRLVVQAPDGMDLAATVHRLDPSGRDATVVVAYDDETGANTELLGVERDRFAHVAFWRDDFAGPSLTQLMSLIAPPAPDPLVLHGSRLRMGVHLARVQPDVPLRLTARVQVSNTFAPTPVDFAPLKSTSSATTLTAALPRCPCTLRSLEPSPAGSSESTLSGRLTVTSMEERVRGRWRPVHADLGNEARWLPETDPTSSTVEQDVRAVGDTLVFNFRNVEAGTAPTLDVVDRPAKLPALVTRSVVGLAEGGQVRVRGLDGQPLPLDPVAQGTVPGAPATGVIVDGDYAQRASTGNSLGVRTEVWVSQEASSTFPTRLRQAGVVVFRATRAEDVKTAYGRQGPALSLVLFLADAAAAAVLAAGGAILGLYLAGRRRTYERAALNATGAPVRTLRRSLFVEQAITLGFGVLTGVSAGLLAAWLALRSVPMFLDRPDSPKLLYTPEFRTLTIALAVSVAVLAACAVLSALALVRSARPEQLREAPA